MHDAKLGQRPSGNEQRDAIHVAIAPVLAGASLRPGEHVGIRTDGTIAPAGTDLPAVGIVDPFLKTGVHQGDSCWLVLYPQTITSLRHDWTHPAFPQERSSSEQWLRDLAEECDMSYGALMEAIPTGRIHTGDREMSGCRNEDDIIRHYENVTGRRVKSVYFSCAC